MKPELKQLGPPPRTFPAHWVVAGLACLGSALLQFAWPALSGDDHSSRWPLAALLVAATGYLLAMAWFHASMARWWPAGLGRQLGSLGRGLACDLIVGCLAATVLANGHTTSLLQAGLWVVPPVLLATSAASALVTALALRDRRLNFSVERRLANTTVLTGSRELPRLILAAVLVLLLFALN